MKNACGDWGRGRVRGSSYRSSSSESHTAVHLCCTPQHCPAAAPCRGGLHVQVVLWAERSWRPPSPCPIHASELLGGFSPLLPCFSPSLHPKASVTALRDGEQQRAGKEENPLAALLLPL